MEGKAMNRVDDHRDSGKLCREAPDEPCFGVVSVDDVIGFPLEVTCEVEDRFEIHHGVEGLYQTGEALHFHSVALNQFDQCSSGGAGEYRFKAISLHASHRQEGVDPRTADDGECVYVEDPEHRLAALPPFQAETPETEPLSRWDDILSHLLRDWNHSFSNSR